MMGLMFLLSSAVAAMTSFAQHLTLKLCLVLVVCDRVINCPVKEIKKKQTNLINNTKTTLWLPTVNVDNLSSCFLWKYPNITTRKKEKGISERISTQVFRTQNNKIVMRKYLIIAFQSFQTYKMRMKI